MGGLYTGYQRVLRFESYWEYSDFFFQAACVTDWKAKHLSHYEPCITRFFHFFFISGIIMAQRSPRNRPTVACSQTLYFLFRDRRARVLTQKPPGIYWPLAKRGWCRGKDCLVPHDCLMIARGRCVSGHVVRASRSSRIRRRNALTEGLAKGKEKIGFRLSSSFSLFPLVLSLSLARFVRVLVDCRKKKENNIFVQARPIVLVMSHCRFH